MRHRGRDLVNLGAQPEHVRGLEGPLVLGATNGSQPAVTVGRDTWKRVAGVITP